MVVLSVFGTFARQIAKAARSPILGVTDWRGVYQIGQVLSSQFYINCLLYNDLYRTKEVFIFMLLLVFECDIIGG